MKVGYISGVFDLMHVGHIRFLAACRDRCDRLIVGVLDDHWVEAYKRQPIVTAAQRVECINALKSVDLAFIAGPTRTLDREFYETHGITVQFVGVDHKDSKDFQNAHDFIELEVVDSGCEVRTTHILERIRQNAASATNGTTEQA